MSELICDCRLPIADLSDVAIDSWTSPVQNDWHRQIGNRQSKIGNDIMETLLTDIRYGIRGLLKRPGFTAIVVITLGLGIGANTAFFSVVNAALLRSLPYRDSGRLVGLWETVSQDRRNPTSYPNFLDWRAQNQSFEEMAAYAASDFSLA